MSWLGDLWSNDERTASMTITVAAVLAIPFAVMPLIAIFSDPVRSYWEGRVILAYGGGYASIVGSLGAVLTAYGRWASPPRAMSRTEDGKTETASVGISPAPIPPASPAAQPAATIGSQP